MINIVTATTEHLKQLAILFDQYRIFYEKESDIASATDFLMERITRQESLIFLAYEDDKAVGFTQLYKSFSSVSMRPIYILNDLFVSDQHRKKGIGEALLAEAKKQCRSKGYKGLALETAVDNPAKQLYERLGWQKDVQCFHYFWTA